MNCSIVKMAIDLVLQCVQAGHVLVPMSDLVDFQIAGD